jgi:hypothetical protein
LSEDGQQITPRDYLESALQPLPGTGKAIAAKNEVSEFLKKDLKKEKISFEFNSVANRWCPSRLLSLSLNSLVFVTHHYYDDV